MYHQDSVCHLHCSHSSSCFFKVVVFKAAWQSAVWEKTEPSCLHWFSLSGFIWQIVIVWYGFFFVSFGDTLSRGTLWSARCGRQRDVAVVVSLLLRHVMDSADSQTRALQLSVSISLTLHLWIPAYTCHFFCKNVTSKLWYRQHSKSTFSTEEIIQSRVNVLVSVCQIMYSLVNVSTICFWGSRRKLLNHLCCNWGK